uniref:NADH dehydrogenase [ubiquinone] 1 alpha subcomplex subunit 13 n=1 Tax=Populus trichocarpa TaxID=3694 RepID=A9P8X2_POPTR|nr:unknown [Populus trichocarpa]
MTEAVIRNKPGMASVKDMPILQDGPPPGGFAPVRFARRIPSKGPSAMAIFLAAFGAFSYGMYKSARATRSAGHLRKRSMLHAGRSCLCFKLKKMKDSSRSGRSILNTRQM